MKINKENIKTVLSLALPAVGEMILYMMIWVLDTMMVGQYGGQIAVSTVGLSSEIIYTFTNIFIAVGLSIGITSIVARSYGSKDLHLAEEYASIGLFIGILIAFCIAITLFIFPKAILRLANAKEDVLTNGTIYMKIVSLGIFFSMLTSLMNSIVRGYGNTKIPLCISILINIVNLTLDYGLIFGKLGFPELGIRGAAIATSIANLSGFMFGIYYLFTKSKIKPKIKYIKNINISRLKYLIGLSIPSSLQEASLSLSKLINTFMIMHLGTVAFASNQIALTVESISFMPGWGFAVAATTLTGHKVGEKSIKKAKEYSHTCTLLGICIMGITGLIFLIFPSFIIRLFIIRLFITSSEKQVIDLGSRCLMIASLEQIPMAISMILGGSLKGFGDTKTPFLVSFVSSWLLRLPLMFYFIYIIKSSVTYVWWITSIQWIFEAICLIILFRKKFNK
ncbi:MATE family efflux transporter [Clostridium sporogenes]|uniref:MATE family efflux transporter n=1 Tax=Clostridium sporogenes TaxID=1509 RepID=UPI0022382606|nr:MATE family efflux transporter [Clostridium sporogenes]MCW6107207.1 MATE family efflux transporter [Clostridium sporogenes]